MCSHLATPLAVLIVASGLLAPSDGSDRSSGAQGPLELGRVNWVRDYESAQGMSTQSGKPIFVLFQEVPGCKPCQDFGDGPLSHPLMVEAIEDLFVPLAVFNNQPGKDELILKRFSEPPENFPVVRLIDHEGHDLIPRREDAYFVRDIAERMIDSLEAAHRDVPGYLRTTLSEARADRSTRSVVTFATPCFWEGEARLGNIEGVVSTRAATLEGGEVVEVTYDSKTISLPALIRAADAIGYASKVYLRGDEQLVEARSIIESRAQPSPAAPHIAPPSDQKHSLAQSDLRFLPLTPMQATKVNAALRLNDDFRTWLSPRQLQLITQIKRALEADPASLDGLVRPESTRDLGRYEDQLRMRIETALGQSPKR